MEGADRAQPPNKMQVEANWFYQSGYAAYIKLEMECIEALRDKIKKKAKRRDQTIDQLFGLAPDQSES
jgi:hypothetical protein